MQLLEELLEAWRYTRDGIIAELVNLPESKLNEPPAGLSRSALDLANHIVESGRLMAGELSRPDGDFQRKSYAALIGEYVKESDVASSKQEAVELLRRSHAEGEHSLRAAGAAQLSKPIRQFNGVPASRIAWLHHGISHEEYHRGQLAIYARLSGETPALTKLIMGG
ncbi:MAG TPA: DinB family protein [Gemmatimonadaceae bacterium]|nr:DinB family protein [Gemmatimonadaceae bacterium]